MLLATSLQAADEIQSMLLGTEAHALNACGLGRIGTCTYSRYLPGQIMSSHLKYLGYLGNYLRYLPIYLLTPPSAYI